MTKPVAFNARDVTRAVKAVKDGGETITEVKIDPDGTIHVLTGEKVAAVVLSPYEAWERENGGRAA